MSKERYYCRRCAVALQGNSELCVRCYSELTVPCSQCMAPALSGGYKPRRVNRGRDEINCPVCKNGRWITLDFTPVSPPP